LGVYFGLAGERTEAVSESARQHLTRIRCSACGEVYQIPFAEAEQLARDAADAGKPGFRCAKCGRDAAWIQPSMDLTRLPPVSQEVFDASIDRGPTRLSEQPGDSDESAEAPLRPNVSSVWAQDPAGTR